MKYVHKVQVTLSPIPFNVNIRDPREVRDVVDVLLEGRNDDPSSSYVHRHNFESVMLSNNHCSSPTYIESAIIYFGPNRRKENLRTRCSNGTDNCQGCIGDVEVYCFSFMSIIPM